ncbi:MAG: hypothetical protein A2033_11845 [Bacteroidetes bacterium GWA2_31_9]|nr:MAG: hypothetical protein A2033_11845 [Bacteroidetes bacterium GWA2_31_9]
MNRRRTDGDETWYRLLDWTKGQKPSERLALQILKTEGFISLDPSHPLGGRDGLKDMIATKGGIKWIGATFFPRGQQSFKDIKKKFLKDSVGIKKNNVEGFAFLTNQELTLKERDELKTFEKSYNIEIYHLERIAGILDSPENYGVRLDFLDIEMTKEEQISVLAITNKKLAGMEEKLNKLLEDRIEKQQELKLFDHPVNELTEEKLLTANKNALIILELENIKERYFSSNWDKQEEIITEIYKFSNHSNHRIALEIFEFLLAISDETRSGMTYKMGTSVFGSVLDFFPSFHDEETRQQSIELARKCILIGDNIAYDSFIHLRNIAIAMWGLTIIKFIYRSAKKIELFELMEEVNQKYNELESNLQRPERTDLDDAQEMTKIFRADLEEWSLSFPMLTPHLMQRLTIDNKK